MTASRGVVFAIAAFVAAVASPPLRAAGKADRIFVNGRIWTGDTSRPWAEALAVRGPFLIAVGSTTEIRRLAEKGTDVVDLKGRFASPGFGDAHVGLMSGSLGLDALDLDGAATLDAVKQRIAGYARSHAQSPWVVGRGWSYGAFPGGLPDKATLDALVPDRPAFLVSYDGHTGWANSAALVAAGISRATPDPAGGAVVRDAKGEPTGALKEEPAMAAVRRLLPSPAPEDKVRALKKGLELAAAQGLTSVHDLTLTEDDVPIFERASLDGGLKVRVYSALPLAMDALARNAQTKARIAQPRWRVGAAFGFVDGVVESRTAALFEPYPGGGTGLLHRTEADLDAVVAAFDKQGFQVILHAVGDRAVNAALNAFERAAAANKTSGRRHRVEHLEIARPADLARFGPLGVVASSQPIFATPDQNHFDAYLPALGPERGHRALAFKSIDDARAVQAFGSNWPVAPISVLRGIYAAVTRQTPEGAPAGGWEPSQRLTTETALRHYTKDAAFACSEDGSRGTLAVGKAADLVVLSDDPLRVPPEALLKMRVLLTVLGGQDTYRARDF